MRIVPSNRQEWIALILFPFKVYTLAACAGGLLWFFCLPSGSGVEMAQVGRLVIRGFGLSALTLLLGGLVQLLFRARRAGIVSFLFAATAYSVAWWFLLYTPSISGTARTNPRLALDAVVAFCLLSEGQLCRASEAGRYVLGAINRFDRES